MAVPSMSRRDRVSAAIPHSVQWLIMPIARTAIEEEVSYVRNAFFTPAQFVQIATTDQINRRCEAFVDAFDTIARQVRPVEAGETAIVTLTKRKTAALLAD